MTPRPGRPYEWDEEKREYTLRIRGVDFVILERADWSIAIHLRSDRDGELRYREGQNAVLIPDYQIKPGDNGKRTGRGFEAPALNIVRC